MIYYNICESLREKCSLAYYPICHRINVNQMEIIEILQYVSEYFFLRGSHICLLWHERSKRKGNKIQTKDSFGLIFIKPHLNFQSQQMKSIRNSNHSFRN